MGSGLCLLVKKKRDMCSKEDERCPSAFVILVICVGGVNEILLIKHFFHLLCIKFEVCLVFFFPPWGRRHWYWSPQWVGPKALFPGTWNILFSQVTIWKGQLYFRLYLRECPELPHTGLCFHTVPSLWAQRWNFNEEHWGMFFQNWHLAQGLVTWMAQQLVMSVVFANVVGVVLMPSWVFKIHPTFRHHNNTQDVFNMCVCGQEGLWAWWGYLSHCGQSRYLCPGMTLIH